MTDPSPNLLLALDSATVTTSIALYDLGSQRLLAEWSWQAPRRHTQDLLATAQVLLGQVGAGVAQIRALAVTTGPGSFTGVRVAISAAKGIGLGLPTAPLVVGIPTLAVTATPWLPLAATLRPAPSICAYLQAGRGRYNWLFFAGQDQLWRPGADEHVAGAAAEFCQTLAGQPAAVWLVGELDDALAQGVASLPHVVPIDAVSGWRRAGQLAQLAAALLAAGIHDDLRGLQPLYLQNP